jgi:maltooligosyltrehalose trehalohydrolase
LIAESDLNDPRVVRRPEVGGYGIDAQWSDDFHHSLHAVLTGERAGYYEDFGWLADVARALTRAYVVDGRYSKHRRRRHGRPIGSLSGHHFLGNMQNHDQIGNRALGERLSQLVGPGRLRVAAALVLMSPFVPMLFQGEEWGASTPFQYFTDHRDRALGRAVSEGRRGEFAAFGWSPAEVPDPQDAATWQRSVLQWDEVGEGPHASLLAWHRYLIRLRAAVPALTDGRLDQVKVAFEEADPVRWLTVRRGPVVVAVNLGPGRQDVPLPLVGAGTAVALASEEDVALDSSGSFVSLPPDSVAILLAE